MTNGVTMTYEAAKREARMLLGPQADGRKVSKSATLSFFEVGIYERGVFKVLAVGDSWESAIAKLEETLK